MHAGVVQQGGLLVNQVFRPDDAFGNGLSVVFGRDVLFAHIVGLNFLWRVSVEMCAAAGALRRTGSESPPVAVQLVLAWLMAESGHPEQGFAHFDDDGYDAKLVTPCRSFRLFPVQADACHGDEGQQNEDGVEHVAQDEVALGLLSLPFFVSFGHAVLQVVGANVHG